MLPKKKILILVEGKKKSDSEFLSYNLMLNSLLQVKWSLPNENCVNATFNQFELDDTFNSISDINGFKKTDKPE